MAYIYSENAAIILALLVVYWMMTGHKIHSEARTDTETCDRMEHCFREDHEMKMLPPGERNETLTNLEQNLLEAIEQANTLDDALLTYTLTIALDQLRELKNQIRVDYPLASAPTTLSSPN